MRGTLRVRSLHHRSAFVLVHGGGGSLGNRGEMRAWQELYARAAGATGPVLLRRPRVLTR